MRRYRLLSFQFDSVPLLLRDPEPADPAGAEQWKQNRSEILTDFSERFGDREAEAKLKNYVDFGPLPFSVLAYHNQFLHELHRELVLYLPKHPSTDLLPVLRHVPGVL